MDIPIIESGRAQSSISVFEHSSVFNADELRVDAVAKLEREEKKGTIGWGLRSGKHGGHGV